VYKQRGPRPRHGARWCERLAQRIGEASFPTGTVVDRVSAYIWVNLKNALG